ncbi:carbon-nitrogen hydrolase, partial [bacterium]|nr:carbon-nitrogen hydrolase [bacterium]
VFSSASPGRGLNDHEKLESARWVERVNKSYASQFTSFVVHCNRVGYEDGLNFWGGSTVFDPRGELVTQAPYQVESLTTCTVDTGMLKRTRTRLPLLRDERTALTQRELSRIIATRAGGWKGHND